MFHYMVGLCIANGCKTVLDVGGGIGILGSFLPKEMKYDVADISRKAKMYGEKMFPNTNFITGGIEAVQDNYDAVLGIQVVEHMNGYEALLKMAWQKTNKLVAITFRNGLGRKMNKIVPHDRFTDYWENRYSYPRLRDWVRNELLVKHIKIKRIKVRRDYSPEIVIILRKEAA